MTRAERRYRADRIAKRRHALYSTGSDIPVGIYRKWNLTCQCSMCRINKFCSKKFSTWKANRRNIAAEIIQ